MTGSQESKAMSKPIGPTVLARIHPVIIRITHWMNFLALTIMVTSGLRIYNASPIFGDYTLPTIFYYGGLAYARQWHFFAMWVFFINGGVWLLYNLFTKHGRKTTLFVKADIGGVIPMIQFYLRLRKDHPPQKKYNALQKLAYTSVAIVALVAICSGISIYWPVQFSWVASIFGGYDTARVIHFLAMTSLVFFFLGHVVMVSLAGWGNFFSMFTGRLRMSPEQVPNL
jgi:thiosulfate reductase cytochrome b subunit